MKKYIILVFVVFFVSCQGKNEKTIESVKVWYYNGIFEKIVAIDCNEIVYLPEKVDTLDILLEDGSYLPKQAVVLESIIKDKEVLQEITNELKLAKKTKNYGMNARMKCYIKFTNGSIDSLCLTESTTYGYYNNKPTAFTNKFIYQIRKNCGYYWWIGKDYMKYLDELNDPSFKREKVKSRWGGEY